MFQSSALQFVPFLLYHLNVYSIEGLSEVCKYYVMISSFYILYSNISEFDQIWFDFLFKQFWNTPLNIRYDNFHLLDKVMHSKALSIGLIFNLGFVFILLWISNEYKDLLCGQICWTFFFLLKWKLNIIFQNIVVSFKIIVELLTSFYL